MAHEAEHNIKPAFVVEKEAVEQFLLESIRLTRGSVRREGEHGYSFLDRDDGCRKMIHVFRSLEEIPPDVKASGAREINGLYIYCPEDAEDPRSERTEGPQKFHMKKEVER